MIGASCSSVKPPRLSGEMAEMVPLVGRLISTASTVATAQTRLPGFCGKGASPKSGRPEPALCWRLVAKRMLVMTRLPWGGDLRCTDRPHDYRSNVKEWLSWREGEA